MVDNDPALKDRDVNFDVNNGAVEIKGSVASAVEKERVGKMVGGVQGVKDMSNGLESVPTSTRAGSSSTQSGNG